MRASQVPGLGFAETGNLCSEQSTACAVSSVFSPSRCRVKWKVPWELRGI